jgi:hypothetical protein
MVEGRNARKRRKVGAPLSKTYSLKPKTADSVAGFRVTEKNIFASLTSSDERKRDFYPTKWRLRMSKQTNLISLLSHPDSAKGKFRLRKNSPLTNSLILLQYMGIKEGRRTGWWKEGMPEKGGK